MRGYREWHGREAMRWGIYKGAGAKGGFLVIVIGLTNYLYPCFLD